MQRKRIWLCLLSATSWDWMREFSQDDAKAIAET
jgi:hypothetical protein